MNKPSLQVVFDLDTNECYVITEGVKKPTTRHRIHVELDGGGQIELVKWPSKKSKKNQ